MVETRLILMQLLPVSPVVAALEFGSEDFQRLEVGRKQQQHSVNGLSTEQVWDIFGTVPPLCLMFLSLE